jgi:hypothetical protein
MKRTNFKRIDEMKEKGVYEKICKSELPNGCTCIKNKWVIKIKRNGIFRARLVACGYSQVPGVYFQESFSTVIDDVTFRILLITILTWNLKGKIVDIRFFMETSKRQSTWRYLKEWRQIKINV